MENYETVVGALAGLKERGYELDFNIAFDKIMCVENGSCLNPNEFEIVETYRFEGNTDPGDEDIVYAITSKDGSMKGSITSAYGAYADNLDTEMMQKLAIHH